MTKILIVRFSSIGDIVLTTPVIRCLKKQVPAARVHYLTKPAYSGILEGNPYIDKVHVLDKPLLKKAAELRVEGFDIVIDLHANLRTFILKNILGIPASTFRKLNFRKWRMVNIGAYRRKPEMLPHVADRYLEAVEKLGVKNDGAGLDYFLRSTPVQTNEHYIAFVIGAKHATKRMPAEKIISVCRLIGSRIILLGGKEDEATGEKIAAAAGTHVTNACGKLSLDESAAVIRDAYRVVTHDTGLMHIAAAMKKEIVSVWGNTVPEFGMTPYYGNTDVTNITFEVKDLACRPCSKIGYNACPLGHFKCMQLQDEKKIAAAAGQ